MNDTLTRQFDTALTLARYHLDTLEDAHCVWRPTERGPHVRHQPGHWFADWPEDESYGAGSPSIGWLCWHILYWWSMALDHNFGDGTLDRHDVVWPGSADGFRAQFDRLAGAWQAVLHDLQRTPSLAQEAAKWPFAGRSRADIVAWVNLELVKNAAEIGILRFVYASEKGPGLTPEG
jgi:hypothetical protein